MMESITETCVVQASKEDVFNFLSDIKNLPDWSTQFVKKLFVVGEKYKAITPLGDVFVRIDAMPLAGLIDIYAGPTEQNMRPAYLRVIRFDDATTGVMFTFFRWDETDDKSWKAFGEWIKIEVGNIKRLFS